MHLCILFVFLLYFSFVSELVELGIAEIERNVDGYLDEVQYVEEEAEVKYECSEAACCGITERTYLNYLSCDSECVTDKQEYLKKQ